MKATVWANILYSCDKAYRNRIFTFDHFYTTKCVCHSSFHLDKVGKPPKPHSDQTRTMKISTETRLPNFLTFRQCAIQGFKTRPASCACTPPPPTTWWETITPTTNQKSVLVVAVRFVSLTQTHSGNFWIHSGRNVCCCLFFHIRWRHTEEYTAAFYIQWIFPPPCCTALKAHCVHITLRACWTWVDLSL